MLRKTILLSLALLAAAPLVSADAFAQRGRGGDRHDDDRGRDRDRDRGRDHDRGRDWNRGKDWDRGRDWDRHDYRDRSGINLGLGLLLGVPLGAALSGGYDRHDYGYGNGYRDGYSYNQWGLYPNQCRWDRDHSYWYNRPALIEYRRCADSYGNVYIVQGSQRLVHYR